MANIDADDTKPYVYEERFNNILYSGVISLGIGLGHRVGLFKALTDFSEPETSRSIADHAGLNERYVREWLFSMAAAKVVFITDDNKYYIPSDCKTKTSKSLLATMILATAPLTKDVEKCFRSKDQSSADKIMTILDIGCGTGRITANIAHYFPGAKVVGIDVDQFAIDTALKLKEDENLTNVEFCLLGGESLKDEWTERFDWITMLKVFHDLPNPGSCLKGAMRALKDDGVLTFHDPLCHSDPKLNVGSNVHASTLTLSCYVCLPCSLSAPPAVGNGIGWGLENRAKYLRDNGLTVHGNESVEVIHCSKTLK
ncbi:S-adenosylmethionine-dependent methyltransferase Rv2258c-like [Mytilus californianus]|uniref:S-adenosylmethionine-dependent methyltransferase Rv2258c-like n=1 Tax=Mytilus californianus TaxID=6549 RepID=UPI0022459751|nr:S-adenosylmethionine-dependent methyltransferase Rv2258c-like [Mytilus californianus]